MNIFKAYCSPLPLDMDNAILEENTEILTPTEEAG
jgi:hypothetical protein